VLTKDELVCAGAFFHASRERFFGGGAWLTPAYVGDLLHQCFEGGAVIGLFDQLTLKELRGLVGFWTEPSSAALEPLTTAFVPFALNSQSRDPFAFLAGLDALSHHLGRLDISQVAFVVPEDDAPRRRLYERFASETGREEKRGIQVLRYEADAAKLRALARGYRRFRPSLAP
jgi:hypothetical protein